MTRETLTTKLMVRVLEDPASLAAIAGLDPGDLGRIVTAVGLADAGEVLAVVSDAQMTAIADDLLWDDDVFDDAAFETWLEVIAEGGTAALARRLAALSEDTLTRALHGQLHVVDADTLGIGLAGASRHEAELAERVLDAALFLELDDFTLLAKRSTGWDVTIESLLALDRDHHQLVTRVLTRCAAATVEILEDHGGLQHLLGAAQMLDEDAGAERDDRRVARGFVSSDDARAFLVHARGPASVASPSAPSAPPPTRDFVTRRYLETRSEPVPLAPTGPLPVALRQLVSVATPTATPALGGEGHATLRAALNALSPEVHERRRDELAYLANVIVAAEEAEHPLAAAHRVIEVCARGLSRVVADTADSAEAVLARWGMDQLFVRGLRAPPPKPAP